MKSIQGHLTRWLVTTIALLAAICGVALYFYVKDELTEEFDRAAMVKARMVGSWCSQDENGRVEFDAGDEMEMAEFRPRVRHHPSYFEIWEDEGTRIGKVVARSPTLLDRDLPCSGIRVGFQDLGATYGVPLRAVKFYFTPEIQVDEDEKGPTTRRYGPTQLVIVLATDRQELDKTLNTLGTSLAAAGCALLVAAICAVTLTVRRGLRPLRQLGVEADVIDAGSLNHRFSRNDLPKELAPIAQHLNSLLQRLDEAFSRERRFTSDAAHELRTPIAELRSLAEVALKWPDKTASEQNYRDVLGVAEHMESLVGTLLAIARCRAGTQPADLRPVDLKGTLQEAWLNHATMAEQRKLEAEWKLPPEATVRGDRAMLLAMIDNLLSNAVTYAPEGSRIDVQIDPIEQGFELAISNLRGELTSEDVPHLFEPFWRKDASRSGGVHCGLGLPLVAAYAAAMGMTVHAEITGGGLFRISVMLNRPVAGMTLA